MSHVQAHNLKQKRILLIVGGGIAAYKSLDLVRRLRECGAGVSVVMTAAAKQFVTPLSFASLTQSPVYDELFSATTEQEISHIHLSRAADLVVVAPATANLIARAATGLCDDLATTVLLATDKKTLYAPSMNLRMWAHPATQENIDRLKDYGALFVGPNTGDMACGEYGPGRMSEPAQIVSAIESALMHQTQLPLPQKFQPALSCDTMRALAGKHVVVTSGPTHEAIDPVRYIANRSSGKQGHAIARAAVAAGARVTLISGPVALSDPEGCQTIHVLSARDMCAAAIDSLPADIFIGVAAVADWRVAPVDQKIKKDGASSAPALTLIENPDILATIASSPQRPALVVGFAAETQNLLSAARDKLIKKGCDMIVANDVGVTSDVFGGETNDVHIITSAGVESWDKMTKSALADRLIGVIANQFDAIGVN